jgi:hypothetical protein
MRKLWILLLAAALLLPATVLGQGCMGGGGEEGVNVVGFIQPQFEYHPNSCEDRDYLSAYNTFSFKRARLGVVGDVPYDISYYFVMEFGPLMSGEPPYMLDAFITYTRYPKIKLSFGQFKYPFSMERNTSCSDLHTVLRSKVVDNLVPDRDMGVMALGTLAEGLEYRLGLMNGAGTNNMDGNSGKDIVGRLIYTPIEYLTVGGGFASGNSEPIDGEGDVVKDEDDYTSTRYGGEFEFRYDGLLEGTSVEGDLLVQGEYIYGKDEGGSWVGGGCGGDPEFVLGSVERDGFFVTCVYSTPWNFEPVYKYERWDPDTENDDDMEHVHTFGFNYFMNDWTRFQVNYLRRIEDYTPALKNDVLLVQMQVKIQ